MLVECKKGQWTKVATAVTKGYIKTSKTDPTVFYQAWRNAGDSSPPADKPFSIDGQVRLIIPEDEIKTNIPIDIYIYAENQSGSVRVDI